MDDLFDEPQKILTVTQLTRSVRSFLETEIGEVWVAGEVSNFRRQASGHQYFTLKDEKCQLACVLFYRPAQALRQAQLADGMQVQVRGHMTVYEARGQYHLNVQIVQAGGTGLLQARFEALKRKLDAEGLFDSQRKKSLPEFPTVIGIVTSPTGAAIRDMLNILERRAPWIRIVINPVRVQGAGAAEEIAAAVAEFNGFEKNGLPRPDVIVVARGGGSAEDLWAFNEEVVARAIFASAIPVVSAVGHEIDFTISDFVADLRAPTPSAAAELIAPDSETLLRHIAQVRQRAVRSVSNAVVQRRERLAFIERGVLFREAGRRISEWRQTVDDDGENLRRLLLENISDAGRRLAFFSSALRQHRPDQVARLRREQLFALRAKIGERLKLRAQFERHRLQRAQGLLGVLAPDATLRRGYSITTDADGKLIRSVADARKGMEIRTQVSDGSLSSEVV
jgi:exodeoxyribonuclease VII large subunit